MTDFSGVFWRVNYGEISEREQFRVGYVGQTAYEAYFEVAALTELISILNEAKTFPVGQISKGVTLQAVKVAAGHTSAIVIEPLSGINPEQIMRLDLATVDDLVYALQLFQTNLPEDLAPEDWDFSDLYLFNKGTRTFKEKFLPERLSEESLQEDFATSGAVAEVSDRVGGLESLTSSGRLSDSSLKGTFLAFRLWDGSQYPDRIEGAVNIFLGSDQDPGLKMNSALGDIWADPELTTLNAVVAAMLTNGSALNEAAKSVNQQVFAKSAADLEVNSPTAAPLSYLPNGSSSMNGTVVRNMNPTTPSYLSALFPVPRGWKSVKYAVYYTHSDPAPTGGVRVQLSSQEVTTGSVIGTTAQWEAAITDTPGTALVVRRASLPTAHIFTGTPPFLVRVGLYRNVGHSGDTFPSDASIIAVEMTRDS